MFEPYIHDIDPVLGERSAASTSGGMAWGIHPRIPANVFLPEKTQGKSLFYPLREVYTLSLFIIFGILLGGRIIEVAFDEWPFYSRNPGLIPAFWLGGMASHGVMMGGVVGLSAFAWIYKKSFLSAR